MLSALLELLLGKAVDLNAVQMFCWFTISFSLTVKKITEGFVFFCSIPLILITSLQLSNSILTFPLQTEIRDLKVNPSTGFQFQSLKLLFISMQIKFNPKLPVLLNDPKTK